MTMPPACPTLAPCSPGSSTLRGGLRPCLTTAARDACAISGRKRRDLTKQKNTTSGATGQPVLAQLITATNETSLATPGAVHIRLLANREEPAAAAELPVLRRDRFC